MCPCLSRKAFTFLYWTKMDDSYTTPSLLSLSPQNDTSQDNICVFNEEFKFWLLPVSYGVVLVLGLPLNLTAIWIFLAKMRPWSPTTVYMINLAISDTLYLLSLPTLIYYYADRNNWPFGVALCKFIRFLFYANLYCSILFLTGISIHRYMGVCHPLRSLQRIKARYAHMFCGGVWLSVGICLIPNLKFVTVSPRGNDTLCHDTTQPEDFEQYVDYSTAIMSLLFGIPCLVIAGCYGLMTRELMKPLINGSQQTLPSYKKKSIKTIVVVLTVFIICFLPFHVTRTMYYYARLLKADCQLLNVINFIYKITRPLASANSCFDPVLYFLASEKYQKKLVIALSGACVRRLPVSHIGLNLHRRSNLAVVSDREIQANGSLGNLLEVRKEEERRTGVVAEENGGKEINNPTLMGRIGRSVSIKNKVTKKKDFVGREDIRPCEEDNNGSEHNKEAGDNIEGEHVVESSDVNITINRQKSEKNRGKVTERNTGSWSLKLRRDVEGSIDGLLVENFCEGDCSSSWNLLDCVTQGDHCVRRSPRDDLEGERKLQNLPNI